MDSTQGVTFKKVLMVVGVRESAFLNKLFTLINVSLLSFIIICGATKADFSNWSIKINVIL